MSIFSPSAYAYFIVSRTQWPMPFAGRRPRSLPLRASASTLIALVATAAFTGCGSSGASSTRAPVTSGAGSLPPYTRGPAGGSRRNIYANDAAGDLSPVVRGDPALVYVPNSASNTVDEISQRTFTVVKRFPTGELPQHVTPSYDLKTLYVDNDVGNTLTPIDPRTGTPRAPLPVEDPYNLYFTPDGSAAIVVSERLRTLAFRDPGTMRPLYALHVPACAGVDHMDFSADGRLAYASCEFAGRMIEVDLATRRVVKTLVLGNGASSPQDVKLSPDGGVLYVADQAGGGLWELNPATFRVTGFLHTGAGAHGLYPSRDARMLYVSNRAAGSVSVVSFASGHVVATWRLPPPASPDMGGVSADGTVLWLSGRYDAVVYAIDTATGRLRAKIRVGQGPHGMSVWPQPGRYSLGHTGILR